MAIGKSSIVQRLDQLYEFDREPVTGDKLQGPANLQRFMRVNMLRPRNLLSVPCLFCTASLPKTCS